MKRGQCSPSAAPGDGRGVRAGVLTEQTERSHAREIAEEKAGAQCQGAERAVSRDALLTDRGAGMGAGGIHRLNAGRRFVRERQARTQTPDSALQMAAWTAAGCARGAARDGRCVGHRRVTGKAGEPAGGAQCTGQTAS